MKIYVSRHAKRRMKERKIVQSEILEVLELPDNMVTPPINGRINYIKAMDGRRLKVTCKNESDTCIIITVMDRNA